MPPAPGAWEVEAPSVRALVRAEGGGAAAARAGACTRCGWREPAARGNARGKCAAGSPHHFDQRVKPKGLRGWRACSGDEPKSG